ncbi:hypothetical protein ACPOLB_23470 [Rubrivivax sp. RP6-9]|uniref:hypothetical protein n=1 Tax=Rubrivivax sp. RP6-9 TaxID=3415750 RepID=UPI003CC658BB
MPLPLVELKKRLSSFTEEFARSLTYESALKLLADGNSNRNVTYAKVPPEDFELTFLWEVLSHEEVEGKPAARILTHVCDDREKGKLGSVWTPLCGGGWIYTDGSFEQHELGNLAADSEED